jgi:hypothetical protein
MLLVFAMMSAVTNFRKMMFVLASFVCNRFRGVSVPLQKRKYFLFTLCFSFVFSASGFSQDSLSLQQLQEAYESCVFSRVTLLSEQILSSKISLSVNETIQLYTMSGVAHYSLAQEIDARKCFVEILKLNKDYTLDPVSISPKIITFFEKVRREFFQIADAFPIIEKIKKDTLAKPQIVYMHTGSDSVTAAFLRSLFLPGWGHLYLNQQNKGYVLSAASIANGVAMAYFFFDANIKEQKYLNEGNTERISTSYDTFNASYKIRNVLIGSYVALWLYSQIDLANTSKQPFAETPQLSFMQNYHAVQFTVRFPF